MQYVVPGVFNGPIEDLEAKLLTLKIYELREVCQKNAIKVKINVGGPHSRTKLMFVSDMVNYIVKHPSRFTAPTATAPPADSASEEEEQPPTRPAEFEEQPPFPLISVKADMTAPELADAFSNLMDAVDVVALRARTTKPVSLSAVSKLSDEILQLHQKAGFPEHGHGCCFSCDKDSGTEKYCESCQQKVADPCKKLLESINVRWDDKSSYSELYDVHLPKLKGMKDEPLLKVATDLSDTIEIFRDHYNRASSIVSALTAATVALEKAARVCEGVKIVIECFSAELPPPLQQHVANFQQAIIGAINEPNFVPEDAVHDAYQGLRANADAPVEHLVNVQLALPAIIKLLSVLVEILTTVRLVATSVRLFWVARTLPRFVIEQYGAVRGLPAPWWLRGGVYGVWTAFVIAACVVLSIIVKRGRTRLTG